MKYIFIVLIFIGCGSNDIDENRLTSSENIFTTSENSSDLSKNGKAQLGVMSKSTIKLYELSNGNQKLLATTVTSSGTIIDSIGNFHLFLDKLDDDKFYLYEVNEGEDYDIEDDGIVNSVPTTNKGKFHLLVQGSTIKAIKKANITILSEIVYQRVKSFLNKDNETIKNEIIRLIKELISTDVNGDAFIGREDLLRYNPVMDKDKLQSNFRPNIDKYIDNILNDRAVEYLPNPKSIVQPVIGDVVLNILENRPIGITITGLNIISSGDSNITEIRLEGEENDLFEVSKNGEIKILAYLDYEKKRSYALTYIAKNDAGDSNEASLLIQIENIIENRGSDYAKNEIGIQKALDNKDNDYVLNQLLNNRENYTNMSDDAVNVNIAAAYIGKSNYTVFNIVDAMNNSNEQNNFNAFVDSITNGGNSVDIIANLKEADKYYTEVIGGLDCNNTSSLSDLQKDSCVNLGLVRLTALSNSVKLLFGGDDALITKWADGVDVNSSEDLNGNGVIDEADASACAIVYANNPLESCQEGSSYSYRGKIVFTTGTTSYDTTLIEVDVGSGTYGYNTFFKLITNKETNNSPLLTSGVCTKSFINSSYASDGVNYFPCPTLDSSSLLMELKSNLELGANIEALFPDGSATKTNVESYLNSITGSVNGTIGLDNLSQYLQVN